MRSVALTWALLPLVACAGAQQAASGGVASPPSAPAAVPSPSAQASKPAPAHAAKPAPLPDFVRYGPSAMRYVVHRELHVEQAYGGKQQSQDLAALIYVRVSISGPADTGGYPVSFIVDSVVPDSGMPQVVSDNMARVRALMFRGRLRSDGDFRGNVQMDTTIAQSIAQFVANFHDFFPRIPAAGVRVGEQWTDTVAGSQRAGESEVTRRAVVYSQASAWDVRNGTRSLRIEATTSYTVSGAGQNSGQPFEMSGGGATASQAFLAEDGRFLGGESRDSTDMTISLPVQGLAIPVRQRSHSTITAFLLP